MNTTKFAYYHLPSEKWCKLDIYFKDIVAVDNVYDCLYSARNIIEEDFYRCGQFVPCHNYGDRKRLTAKGRKDFALIPVDVSFNFKLPHKIRKIEYNTFGKKDVDNKLVDFLNSLKDDQHLIEGIQTKVMAFMHRLNKDMFDLYLQNADFFRRGTSDTSFIHRLNELFLADYKKRLKNMNWREPLKCAVNACIMERYRDILKVENSLLNVTYRNKPSKK